MKKSILLQIFGVFGFCGICQPFPGDRTPIPGDEPILLQALKNASSDIDKAEALLDLGAYYLYLSGEEKSDLEKSKAYTDQARYLSNKINYRPGLNESMLLIGNMFLENRQKDFSEIIFDSLVVNLKNARFQFQNEKNIKEEARVLRQLSWVYVLREKYDEAETELLEVVRLYKKINYRHLHYNLERLCNIRTIKDDWTKALYYALETVKSMEACNDYRSAGSFYYNLGYVYRQIGQFQKSIDYYKIAFAEYEPSPSSILYDLSFSMMDSYVKMNKNREAVDVMFSVSKKYPPTNNYELGVLENGLGVAYRNMKNFDSSEMHFQKLKEVRKNNPGYNGTSQLLMGQMYMEWGRYDLAKPLLEKTLVEGNLTKRTLGHVHYMLFKIDSAQGNYVSAMDHLVKNKAIDDQIYEEVKVRENSEMQVKYETEKKNNEIKLKEQDILLLSRKSMLQQKDFEQARLRFEFDSVSKAQNLQLLTSEATRKDNDLLLQRQNIELLQKQDLLKQSSLGRANLIKNMTIGGIVLLLIILALLFNQYRIKNKNNREVSEKNISLQHMVEEKEWLLKEVHHRVKNNLHTIISLLESQSAYLNGDALAAMQNSQHRVYAMSLIHQKLYQLENTTTVEMSVYLQELISYLRDFFDTGNRIRFNLDIEKIQLDISKAIPVCLIINEAITNSIKYAFPEKRSGEIDLAMSRTSNGLISLVIKDNGIGLPQDWSTMQRNSLGLKLMKGLSEDLEGIFSVEVSHGTVVRVQFPGELAVRLHSNLAGLKTSQVF